VSVTWYFDFISPYAYFGSLSLNRLPAGTALSYQPVLFAGLLNHWGQKGPAEIPPKRVWTYRSCIWWAEQHAVPFRMPAAHPFNSLPYLRLCIAAGATARAVHTIFAALWTTGVDAADPAVLQQLAQELQIDAAQLLDAELKRSLRVATDRAVTHGVFGVPTLRVEDELFWGNDAVDFATAYLTNPGVLATPEMQRAAALPVGAARPGS
jgi:2-hydroxychromene-2-carboxylate isomerase